ncbi:hypothetical protein JW851_00200 [Candidatus Woesearchaeota archaeon]|nr:hypothetical protein [Candidatus Woesearchaeota archaeon]
MKKIWLIGLLLLAFSLGWAINDTEISPETEMPLGTNTGISPNDWIKQDDIHVYRSHIEIDLKNAVWANFTDTNSMTPVLGSKSNAIQVKPQNEEDIHIGDVISFRNKVNKRRIIHRVIGIGNDPEGRYFLTKGDNNKEEDNIKVRFNDIERVLVAVVY